MQEVKYLEKELNTLCIAYNVIHNFNKQNLFEDEEKIKETSSMLINNFVKKNGYRLVMAGSRFILLERDKIQEIKENKLYKEILKHSFGDGTMFTMDKKDAYNYDTKELLGLWDSMTNIEKQQAGEVINRIISFIKRIKKIK